MKHEILPDQRLRIYCTPEEQAELQMLKEQEEVWGTLSTESEILEPLLANSELEWIPEGVTSDLTSAPMLGILGEEIDNRDKPPPCFGTIDSGDGMKNPIIARWAFMSYQVRSFLDYLAEKGECFWDGGYAEGIRPDSVEMPQSTEPTTK